MSQKISTEHVQRFLVSGVCCSTEQAVLHKTLDKELGRGAYQFDLLTQELSVPGTHQPDRICELVRSAGFQARLWSTHAPEETFWIKHADSIRTTVAAVLAIGGMTTDVGLLSHGLLLAAIITAGWTAYPKAWKALWTRTLDMNVLMTAATVGALAIDKWIEGAAVMILYSVSLLLESYSLARSRRAIRSLMSLTPEAATVLRGGMEVRVRAEEVSTGERILIRPGERIPFDGTILTGSTSVDQSIITGESIPIRREPGETVFAGSLNGTGTITLTVTHAFRDTTIARIMHLVENAQKNRAPIQGFVERFAQTYTPAVFAIALLVATVPPLLGFATSSEWFYRALVLLVIACPCALVISTPITIVSAMTNAARRGILVKGGKYMEVLGNIQAIAFDKTGTLTEGTPTVTDVIPLDSLSRDQVLGITAAIEANSEHHLAGAVVAAARNRNIDVRRDAVHDFESIPGKGVRASLDGTPYVLGNHQFCHDEQFCSARVEEVLDQLENDGKATMIMGSKGTPLAVIGVMDAARQQAMDTIAGLRSLGIRHLSMLSGDHERTSRATGSSLGIDDTAGGLLPEQKVERVQRLRETFGTVAMVGDGVNDAPALAASSVGVAMGMRGSDASLETADIVLMADDLMGLPRAIVLCRKAMTVVKQNIAIAIGLKALFLALSIAGMATLWMAVLADDGAALIVILNGLRMLTYSPDE